MSACEESKLDHKTNMRTDPVTEDGSSNGRQRSAFASRNSDDNKHLRPDGEDVDDYDDDFDLALQINLRVILISLSSSRQAKKIETARTSLPITPTGRF